ncbi:aspartic peptidase domain-containing protein [Aspergillus pseudotamarii]|uniref:Aspartic peptidase domain-containing protein n=1 Tax=Aspergillus pseudotamarii TaxID=132259 RepID=A0A5N6SIR6_ASPPS|nr:aspartic peptidase domain-containing protein [Aspergillus pseudotamarii]KAE8133571.1 aspartic peptidase domain-containing protein [Aspergillus pseudotamarii]
MTTRLDITELSLRRLWILALGLFSLVAAEPKVITLPFSRSERHILEKRKYAGALLGNDILDGKGLYWVNASVGTPLQPVQLQVDTGSSDVWMFGPQSCDLNTSPCLGNAYDPTLSSTSKILGKGGFSIQYVTPGSGVNGDYVGDNFGFGSITVQGLTMGVARQAQNIFTGIMGIGFAAGESIVSQGQKPYKNIIDMLVEQELIHTRAYSLWLNDLKANFGGIMFGGYDTGKFIGDLIALPIQPDAQTGGITSMTVAWTSLSLTDPKQGTQSLTAENFIAPAILDSGTALTYIPPELYQQLAAFAQVVEVPGSNLGAVDCEQMRSYKRTLDYGFGGPGGPVIRVPFFELAVPWLDDNDACVFGVVPITDGSPILFGDTFLRSAYVVYDLDKQQIAIAPTRYNSEDTNIVEIGGKTGSSSPNWKTAGSNAAKVTQTATGLQAPGGGLSPATMTAPTGWVFSQTATPFHLPGKGGSSSGAQGSPSPSNGTASSSVRGVVPGALASIAVASLCMAMGTMLIVLQ